MRSIVLRTVSACVAGVVGLAGFMIIRGVFLLYWDELHSFWPPPLWKSAIITGLLIVTIVAVCLAVYKLMLYAFRRETD